MAKINLFEFSDILKHAESMGYDWNTIHDVLKYDGCCPMNEARTIELELPSEEETLEDFRGEYGGDASEDTFKILKSFAKKHKVYYVTIT